MSKKDSVSTYSTGQIAKIAGLHPNTVRMYEEWGLIQKPERKANGYRVYDSGDINRLKIIRSLRCSNYSLSAILRLLNRYDSGMGGNNILDILNTPDKGEDIVSVCDKLVVSLENVPCT